MEPIKKEIIIPIFPTEAFRNFVHEFKNWWPSQYTWSQDNLKEIFIDPKKDGLCTEIGPYNFRSDWGRVTDYIEGESISLKWQISPRREPEPDPDKASDIYIKFTATNDSQTSLLLEHTNFENHGEGAPEYRDALDSNYGWDYILDLFVKYCNNT